ncbi:MAG: DNA-3-methyladenine glycosylase [Candidatus Eiseniibacteriota bacterium]
MARANPHPLPSSFYERDTLTVARELLGCVLVRRTKDGTLLKGRIVEVEAYVGEEDKACHARAGRTPRTEVLYGPPGLAYVYLTYGMHHLLNAVTESEGRPAAVLIRAAEPLSGLERMSRARGLPGGSGAPAHQLMSGPAKLCEALGLDLRHNRTPLRGPLLSIHPGEPVPDARVAHSARIGCESAASPWDTMPWRFYEAGSRFVTPGRVRDAKTRGGKRGSHRE